MNYKQWQYDYFYYMHPDAFKLPHRVQKEMKATDFSALNALIFKAGWDARDELATRQWPESVILYTP